MLTQHYIRHASNHRNSTRVGHRCCAFASSHTPRHLAYFDGFLGPMMLRCALVAIASIGLAWTVSAESVFGSNDYVEAIVPAAPAPILLTVPHGGSLLPASIPDRTAGCGSPCSYGTCQPGEVDDVNCPASTLKDLMTSEFALALADALESTFGTRPGIVLNHLHRSKVHMWLCKLLCRVAVSLILRLLRSSARPEPREGRGCTRKHGRRGGL